MERHTYFKLQYYSYVELTVVDIEPGAFLLQGECSTDRAIGPLTSKPSFLIKLFLHKNTRSEERT